MPAGGCSCHWPSTHRSPATRAWRGAWQPGCRVMPTTRQASSAPTARPTTCSGAAAPRCSALPSISRSASRGRCRPPTPHANTSPDLQFTGAYRVPFQYSRYLREHLRVPAFVREASGVTVTDLDGNTFYDLTGSYGVNVFGVDFYKECIADGCSRVQALGPVLGSYHPCVADNVQRLCRISGMDEVSFHMSGTEAVMQAVRLARYHTGRKSAGAFRRCLPRLVGRRAARPRQPAAAARDLHAARNGRAHASACCARAATSPACWSIRCRRCTPTRLRPATPRCSTAAATPHFDRDGYARWLRELRAVCSERGIALIFDEVFVGFRLARGRRAAVLRRAGRPRDLWQDGGRRAADRRGVRAVALDEALSRRPPGRHLLRARHLQLASACDGRDAGVSRALRQRAGAGAVPRARRDLERARHAIQRAHAGRAVAAARGQPVEHLDHRLRRAVALQLDAAVLPARARPGAELGRHRTVDLQPELHAGRLRRGARALRRGSARDASPTAGGGITRSNPIGRFAAGCFARCWRTGSSRAAARAAFSAGSARDRSAGRAAGTTATSSTGGCRRTGR